MNLDDLRRKIDAIDTELLRLLNERADVVHEVGLLKKREGLAIYAPEREDALLKRLVAKSRGRLSERSIRAIYREIMSAALALEEDLRIAYLGPPGTWTHEAALGKFGRSVAYRASLNAADVFDQVQRREADYGVVPIESSHEGAAQHVLGLFAAFPLKICAQILLPIEICLMASVPLESVERVFGHPEVIARARRWLSRGGRSFQFEEVSSTERAAALAREAGGGAAVAGSRLSAELAGLPVVAGHIQDEEQTTRFVVVGRKACPPTGDDLTSLIISDRVNTHSVLEALSTLSALDVQVAQLDSQIHAPSPGRFSFYVEAGGHEEDEALASAIRQLRDSGKTVTVLGSYPRPAPGEG